MTRDIVTDSDPRAVFVEAPARLHFGVLDLRGALGRWFGGIGAAAPEPTLLLSACPGQTLAIEGQDAERAATFARRFLDHYNLPHAATIRLHRGLRSHAGLGSGTQLALAVGRALAELHNVAVAPRELALAVGRGERSAIGTWTFAGGGLVVEGGRRHESDAVGPLLARLPFPSTWRCIVAVPEEEAWMTGAAEAAAFAQLPKPPDGDVERVAHLVLMALLPALVDGDLATFGGALTSIQQITGRWFADVQGGTFAPGPSEELVRCMAECGAPGVGQSSWGPAVYGIVDGEAASRRLADRVRERLGSRGTVYEGPFRTTGARVWVSSPGSEHQLL
jgi:beta-ribofuranosylaminobenzene 5'-phosphate synthase